MKSFLAALIVALLSNPMATAQTQKQITKKTLVAYYSWSGNTKKIALEIAKETQGDLFEIIPVRAYSNDYNECISQASKEIKAGFKPEIKSMPEISKYDTIYIGSPNWRGTIAPPAATFIEKSGNLTGKKLIPFFTHGGGGIQRCEKDVKAMGEKAGAKVLPAKTWSDRSLDSAVNEAKAWVKGN